MPAPRQLSLIARPRRITITRRHRRARFSTRRRFPSALRSATTTLAPDWYGNQDTPYALAVSGTKRVRGINTGDPLEPIVPTSWEPADFQLTFQFDHFTASSSNASAYPRIEVSGVFNS